MKKILETADIVAVVGASLDSRKYGYKVFFDLKEKGYNVYAVHPDGGYLRGQPRYLNLRDLPRKPDLVVTVVRPEVTEKILEDCQKIGIKKIWMQSGSESQKAIEFCRRNKIDFLAGTCIILDSNN